MAVDDHHNPPAQDPENSVDYPRGSSAGDASIPPKPDLEPPPNKVYIGGLPEHTRQEDLQNCFGKIGDIVAIELKVGYGFVEFETREAAEMSVSKYHEGTFMGNKIRVELSRGGGRTAKYSSDPLSCFRCGEMGHWARSSRECPHHPGPPPSTSSRRSEPPLIDRIERDYLPPPPPRDSRDTRDARYDYPTRDYRRPPSPPPRDYYPPRSRYDDYPRDRDRYVPPPPPPADYRSSRYAEPAYRGPPAPSPYAAYDRYDRYSRDSKYANYPPPAPAVPIGRPRTPPRYRDEYAPPRDYDYRDRGRPLTPPRYADYPPRGHTPERFSRRSASPPPRSAAYDYSGPQNGNYPTTPPGAPPRRSSRDYSRSGHDAPADVYRRA
ncbi:RNA-binding domain-containing protein [Gymnopus androsaceus JB14]|uniref:RNA-binding domain-containing protein n=1 Tax=Gymnopus androsaceus JB14 TaxID=1447944 RepID=A0A6A4HFM0_9AGAR|nr:RNA-binding domain-containing protein [Gymnopus androsaceus JB14]